MFATLAATLFAVTGVFALTSMTLSCLRYAPSVRALREELANCETARELRFIVVTTHVECERTETWRPGFRPLATGRLTQRPVQYPPHRLALRAAA